ncbi:MAG TPA: hypothetical protein VGE52_06215, partial [Pirellulales bacterium]
MHSPTTTTSTATRAITSTTLTPPARRQDPLWVRWTLISLAVGAMGLLIVIPVAHIFVVALSDG